MTIRDSMLILAGGLLAYALAPLVRWFRALVRDAQAWRRLKVCEDCGHMHPVPDTADDDLDEDPAVAESVEARQAFGNRDHGIA